MSPKPYSNADKCYLLASSSENASVGVNGWDIWKSEFEKL